MIIVPSNVSAAANLNWYLKKEISSADSFTNSSSGYIVDMVIVGTKLYFPDTGNNWNPIIRVVSLTTGLLLKSITLDSSGVFAGVAKLAAYGTNVYVAVSIQQYASPANAGGLFVIDTTTDTVSASKTSSTPPYMQEISISQNGSFGYVGTGGSYAGTITKFTPPTISTLTAVTGLPSTTKYTHTLVESDTKLYVCTPSGIEVINTSTNAYVKYVGAAPTGYAIQFSDKVHYVGNSRAYAPGYDTTVYAGHFIILDTTNDTAIGVISFANVLPEYGGLWYSNVGGVAMDGTDAHFMMNSYNNTTGTYTMAMVTIDTTTHTIKSASVIGADLGGGEYCQGWARKSDTGDLYYGTYSTPGVIYSLSRGDKVFAPNGNGAAFCGDAKLALSANSAFAFSADHTIECWIFPNTTDRMAIWGNGAPGTDRLFSIAAGTGTAEIYWGEATLGGSLTSTTTIPVKQWSHIAVSRSGSTIRAFVNGVKVAEKTGSGSFGSSSASVQIGSYGTLYYLKGHLSNLRIVKDSAVYTANFTPPTQPLTAISGTSLLACAGYYTKDLSSNNFTITPSGTVRTLMFSPFVETATST